MPPQARAVSTIARKSRRAPPSTSTAGSD
jgi:hypothetical protein